MVVLVFLFLFPSSVLVAVQHCTYCWELWSKKSSRLWGFFWEGPIVRALWRIFFLLLCVTAQQNTVGSWITLDSWLGFVPLYTAIVISRQEVPLTVIISDCPTYCKWSFIGGSAIIIISLWKPEKERHGCRNAEGGGYRHMDNIFPIVPGWVQIFLPHLTILLDFRHYWAVWTPWKSGAAGTWQAAVVSVRGRGKNWLVWL